MIYLASTSPRRKRLLREAGIQFKVLKPAYREKLIPGLGPEALVKRHALEKGKSAAKLVKEGVILSADTIVYFQNRIIGKPRNMKYAVKILSALQGRWHVVYSGVAVLNVKAGKAVVKKIFCVKTRVFIRKMSEGDIRAYFRKINPLDKAGAYAIQSRHSIVTALKGSFASAVGLPVEKLDQLRLLAKKRRYSR